MKKFSLQMDWRVISVTLMVAVVTVVVYIFGKPEYKNLRGLQGLNAPKRKKDDLQLNMDFEKKQVIISPQDTKQKHLKELINIRKKQAQAIKKVNEWKYFPKKKEKYSIQAENLHKEAKDKERFFNTYYKQLQGYKPLK